MKHIFLLLCFLSALSLSACGEKDGYAQPSIDCYLPEGSTVTANQRYIQGPVDVSLGGGNTSRINLYVQRLEKVNSSAWGTEILKVMPESGKTPCETYVEMKSLWQEFYQDMVDANLHSSVIDSYAKGISNPNGVQDRQGSGIYGETHLSSCGYHGIYGTITCVAAANAGIKQYYMAHENTHAFQWEHTSSDELQNIILFRVFSSYANALYHQNSADPGQFTDAAGRWNISLSNYALQNEAEWLAEIFPHFLYGGTGHWPYISNNHTSLAAFLNCVWKEGKTFSQCQSQSGATMVSYAQKVPVVDTPTHTGLSAAESAAIWNVCFDTDNKAAHVATFNNLISSLTSGLYTNAADHYELGYGDCNHDGVLDWVCTYEGTAPGGGNYLWNSSNQVGAYTFIASGKAGDSYAEHKQDPYLSDAGTLVQPIYREWQGNFGSCNGSLQFKRVPTRFPTYSSGVTNLPAELVGKVDW